jgi:hypothetical protein
MGISTTTGHMTTIVASDIVKTNKELFINRQLPNYSQLPILFSKFISNLAQHEPLHQIMPNIQGNLPIKETVVVPKQRVLQHTVGLLSLFVPFCTFLYLFLYLFFFLFLYLFFWSSSNLAQNKPLHQIVPIIWGNPLFSANPKQRRQL